MANITKDEVKTLYAQHTEATGQIFLDQAVERAYYWSDGQPWLVNALARQVVEEILVNDYNRTITAEHIDQAADDLMKRRDTH
ncbi:MAG: ATP-binding protein, partial [Deltaproteobacteria bacterium]|nr:ATP-binding protein [Deltaproteobacteria bacterium]